jgi:hypothetical protein
MTTNPAVRSQRAWARIAGLMYWLVLVADLAGMQLHSTAMGRPLLVAGSLFTVPLALGLYYAVRPVQTVLAASALGFRLLEAALGLISTLAGFTVVRTPLADSSLGTSLLHFIHWDHTTAFGALVFTIGSTIFFYLFVKSGYVPRVLAWWGLFASLLAFAACLTHLLRPSFPAMTMYAWMPMILAETSTGSWLLIKSVKVAE